jgi:hypothetical protein
MSRLGEDGGDPEVRDAFHKTMTVDYDNANGAPYTPLEMFVMDDGSRQFGPIRLSEKSYAGQSLGRVEGNGRPHLENLPLKRGRSQATGRLECSDIVGIGHGG